MSCCIGFHFDDGERKRARERLEHSPISSSLLRLRQSHEVRRKPDWAKAAGRKKAAPRARKAVRKPAPKAARKAATAPKAAPTPQRKEPAPKATEGDSRGVSSVPWPGDSRVCARSSSGGRDVSTLGVFRHSGTL